MTSRPQSIFAEISFVYYYRGARHTGDVVLLLLVQPPSYQQFIFWCLLYTGIPSCNSLPVAAKVPKLLYIVVGSHSTIYENFGQMVMICVSKWLMHFFDVKILLIPPIMKSKKVLQDTCHAKPCIKKMLIRGLAWIDKQLHVIFKNTTARLFKTNCIGSTFAMPMV